MHSLKVVFLGNSQVGKTCIINRYITGEFPDSTKPTIGMAFSTKITSFNVGKETVELQIWDTAGQEIYRGLSPMYYRNSSIIIVVYDVTKPESFDSVPQWIKDFEQNAVDRNTVVIGVCGNKIDLDSQISSFKAKTTFPDLENVDYFQVSALTGVGIENMFQNLIQKYLDTKPHSNTFTQKSVERVQEKTEPSCC
ncbi:small GTP-binding protein [Histomonas meleagridis]|uniref:small GTP-binding protein n=1 Tax=Histomonas meleagridis TaxID=135588 RepID=UPI00355A3312|nr:small GTP-binding protein [Histomonas meleagridis]KAH0804988.1 small GTP-binding protein [Histomonas meleagridis]